MSKTNHKNDVSFSWDLHYACNYRCAYCWWHGNWQHLSKLNRYLSVEEWKRCWGNVYNRYGSVHIEVLGGEPFIYPNFNELVIELSKMHTLGVTTNLSVDIKDFVEQVDSKRVKIMPTFHPMFSDFDIFLKKMILLNERGFTNYVSYLAYPPQISLIDFYRNQFSRENISLFVMTFWGNYNGIEYPQGYTDEEKSIIDGCLGDRLGEKFQLVPKKDFKGKLCHAGHYYAVIQPNGTAIRCGGSGLNEVIGNFFDKNFKLLDRPLSCNAEFCKCNEWIFLMEKDEYKDDVKTGLLGEDGNISVSSQESQIKAISLLPSSMSSEKQDNSDLSVFF